MTSTTTRGLLYSSLHRFNNALENLESFQKEKDIIENIGYLDDFFSNFRSTTFVLQHTFFHFYPTLYPTTFDFHPTSTELLLLVLIKINLSLLGFEILFHIE